MNSLEHAMAKIPGKKENGKQIVGWKNRRNDFVYALPVLLQANLTKRKGFRDGWPYRMTRYQRGNLNRAAFESRGAVRLAKSRKRLKRQFPFSVYSNGSWLPIQWLSSTFHSNPTILCTQPQCFSNFSFQLLDYDSPNYQIRIIELSGYWFHACALPRDSEKLWRRRVAWQGSDSTWRNKSRRRNNIWSLDGSF